MSTLPDNSARRISPAVNCSARAQVTHQRPHFHGRRFGRDGHGRLLEGFGGGAAGLLGPEPVAADDEIDERRRQFGDQCMAGRGRQIAAGEQRVANGRQVAETGDDAVDGKVGDVRIRIVEKGQAGVGGADLGQRRRDGARHGRAPGDRLLHLGRTGRREVDEVGVDEQGRLLDDERGNLRLVERQGMDDRRRRVGAERQRFGERSPHQWRGIVEQHQHRAFGGAAIGPG